MNLMVDQGYGCTDIKVYLFFTSLTNSKVVRKFISFTYLSADNQH